MSDIRNRSLKATTWIYLGFAIGAINTYLLTHKNWFSTEENGLTRTMIEISQLIFAFSSIGTTSFLYKFFPYYKDNLPNKKNDILALSLTISLIGFIITLCSLFFLQGIIIRKFSANATLLVEYFLWAIPFGFFVLLYYILEAYSIGFQKGVITTLLKETILRLYTLAVILLKVFNYISFNTFIILFAFQYAIITIILACHMKWEGKLWLSFKISTATKKYRKKILSILGLTFIVIIVNALRSNIDGLVLASKQNLGKVGIFGLATYMASILQAPLRSIIVITLPILSRAWKDKNYNEIERIYKRTSINLLSFSLFVFFLIWLNYSNAIQLLHINPDYLQGEWVFFILGIVTIIEMGTGVNGQIIATSTFWRFELWTSLLLTSLIIPLSYYLTVNYGIFGPAIANLVSFTIYNSIRYWFLLKKFKMQPFSNKTAEVILIGLLSYYISFLIFHNQNGFTALILGSLLYILLFIALVWWRKITPDLEPIILALKNRISKKTK